jgi:hypothetical protein
MTNPDARELERLRKELLKMLGDVDSRLDKLKDETGAAPATNGRRPARPARAFVLDALDDLGMLAHSNEIGLYTRARYGKALPSTRFGALSSDEQKAFGSSRPRTVYLCHGLIHDRGQSIKRLWGRSDWSIADRVVAPTTGRILHLAMTARLSRIAAENEDTTADPEMMRIIAADHARDLPGVKVKRGVFDLEVWRRTAEELLEELAPRDAELRMEAADHLAKTLAEQELLYGAVEKPGLFVAKAEETGR